MIGIQGRQPKINDTLEGWIIEWTHPRLPSVTLTSKPSYMAKIYFGPSTIRWNPLLGQINFLSFN